MSLTFNAAQGLIRVPAILEGPAASVKVQLILDTGASRTLLSDSSLRFAGYNPSLTPAQIPVTSASGRTIASRLSVTKLMALGQGRANFAVLAHTLPANLKADGLLGLDFLRGSDLTIDFRAGLITLA